MTQVNLSAQGFYGTPDLTFDSSTGKGRMYNYFAYGASASEVEVDTLTGDFTILRSDLVMDVGDSLNPAIDIGQVCELNYNNWEKPGLIKLPMMPKSELRGRHERKKQCKANAHIQSVTVNYILYTCM